ncbi:putative endonuclease [Spiroplasma clarkii]|uniref:DEAD/DEAH box helicase family protein n=1 Tax=Spiroplasma clarkii TaxID=2139 RepID=UPI000B5757A1|nr:DEAD/DEAH box helicase family protein [Spiroplasma clarkii]ARU91863.1 putative endonuclease [Spiroplasma clarkii]
MYIEKYKEVYCKKIGTDSTNEILKRSYEILEETLDENRQPNKQTGLLVGKVQSGKTSNFLGIIATAFDKEYYDTVFLVGGIDNDLLRQNEERVNEVFDDISDDRGYMTCAVFSSASIKSEKNNLNQNRFFQGDNNKVIITILKNSRHFSDILDLINNNPLIWSKRKVLIIDDEGDQGSLDGNANTKKMVQQNETKQ